LPETNSGIAPLKCRNFTNLLDPRFVFNLETSFQTSGKLAQQATPNERLMSKAMAHCAKTEASDQNFQVFFNGELILESTQAIKLDEHYDGRDFEPVIYFPESLISTLSTSDSDRKTHCPIKGDASYLNFREAADGLWCYREPHAQVSLIKNHYAFDQSKGFRVSAAG
jgi:uncharacterized protein (DUF427 family)